MNIVRINGTGGQPIVSVKQSHTVNNSRTVKPVQQTLLQLSPEDDANSRQLASKLLAANRGTMHQDRSRRDEVMILAGRTPRR